MTRIKFFITCVILLSILLAQAALRMPFLREPVEADEGAYAYIAQRLLAGEVPYRDIFDHKPPAIYFIYAGLFKLFGDEPIVLTFSSAAFGMLTTLAVFAVGILLFGVRGALFSAGLYALFSGGPYVEGASANTEMFMVLPMVLALGCFLKAKQASPLLSLRERDVKINHWKNEKLGEGVKWLFLAGFFSGLAVMIKQVAVFNFLVLVGFSFTKMSNVQCPMSNEGVSYLDKVAKRHHHWKLEIGNWKLGGGIIYLLLGFLLFPLAFTLYFWSRGALPDFVRCVF
ncbi:glycosyltransferase family 39 protein, partial [Candidatus Saganbacteria bacterium]|nr:glycosyltransferase family 39 protein [Candidatus Saganbacteria bacterium]